ncbi:MAG: pullulanase-associated domain-containing protein, partial [Nocardioidaceae bacterium]
TYTTAGRLQAVLDFPFQGAARTFASSSGGTNALRDLFANDDYYTDTDSNAYSLPTFLGNHDMGRIGFFLRQDNPGATDAELLARSTLAHALMYTARGMPIVYYGDEQGFTGDGGDKDARQDMMPSQVASYIDDDLIGTDATTADANFDTAHPLYDVLKDLASLKADHPALQHGAQVHRYSSSSAGIYAFSRMIRDEGVEYVVLLNNAETAQTLAIQTYSPQGAGFTGIYPAGLAPLSTDASGRISVTVPPLGFAIYRADAAMAAPSAAPNITFVDPAPDAVITGRAELEAALSRTVFAEVTFAVKVGDAAEWDVVGTDDNAPYRVFYDTSGLGAGTALRFKAVVRDLAGNIDAATRTAMVGQIEEPPPPGGGSTPDYAVVHYQRPAGDYDGWGLHFWGDIDQVVTWDNPVPLAGEDEYGSFAWVKLLPGATSVGFIVHSGDVKDTPDDRFFNPSVTPEIWLKQGDPTVYASQAAAQGYVELHYHRPDGVYDGWGLHLWGDAIDPSEATTWEAPKLPDEIDDYGARWRVAIVDPTKPVNFIVHRGDEKDTPEDRSFLPTEQASAWLQSGDSTVHRRRADAENVAIIHYHRDDGQYGDPTSPDFNDFWGMHVWTGAASPNPSWQEPVRPAGTDRFGVFFEVPLVPGAPGLNYIIHRGDEKDPPPDQFLDVTTFGHEVWYLSGHTDSADIAKYLVPILGGPQIDAD